MQFKHPEILWALLLLLIPILIHLFQLRRFQKTAFTNVKFLKAVKLQTRKSSQLKKWITLLTRLLLLAFAVIAFAQPFTTNSDNFKSKNETVIYLDNSFSMEAKGNNGSLLNEAVQDILKSYSGATNVTLFTNDKVFKNTTINAISNDLISLDYATNQLSYESVYIKGKQYFSKDNNSLRNLVLVSDFQQKEAPLQFDKDSTLDLRLVQLKPVYKTNVSLDSIYISKTSSENTELSVDLSYNGTLKNVSVSLFNNNSLVSKTAVDIDNEASTTFTIPSNTVFNGKIAIEDSDLQYDNSLFFNINSAEKIKVLSVNEASDEFLKKLYTDDEFIYSTFNTKDLDYSQIENQNLIILNEIKIISNALKTALLAFKNNGGSILIIPAEEAELNTYNPLLNSLSLPSLSEKLELEKKVTLINYDHPLINNAFYARVNNFQYPKLNSAYKVNTRTNSVLSFEDNSSFLVGKNQSFLFTSAINSNNSNFKKSPLIVPILYNIGKLSLEYPKLYYQIGDENTIDINTQLSQDEILSLEIEKERTIPLQQTYNKRVRLITNELPKEAATYEVKNKTELLKKISFNYKREESRLTYYNLNNGNNYEVDNSLALAINSIKSNASINALWKWFVIFALVFLIIEMLILKYLK